MGPEGDRGRFGTPIKPYPLSNFQYSYLQLLRTLTPRHDKVGNCVLIFYFSQKGLGSRSAPLSEVPERDAYRFSHRPPRPDRAHPPPSQPVGAKRARRAGESPSRHPPNGSSSHATPTHFPNTTPNRSWPTRTPERLRQGRSVLLPCIWPCRRFHLDPTAHDRHYE